MEKKVKIRSLLVGLFFSLFMLGIIGKLYWVQVVEASGLQKMAEEMWQDDEVLKAKRGMILDRNGRPLAEDAAAYTVALDPMVIHDKKLETEISSGLASILSQSKDPAQIAELQKKIYDLATKKRPAPNSDEYMAEVEIRNEGWKVDGETKQKIDDFIQNLEDRTGYKSVGIYLKETTKRYYPFNRLASHVLGYINKEGKAVNGIESQYNDILSGKPGVLDYQRDRMGIELPDSKKTYIPPVDGKNVKLTIDQNIQYYIENALQKANDKWHPKSVMAIAADPKTMEILGMANLPNFNPNRYWEAGSQADFMNRNIAAAYEPGSTFKLVTLAGTIEENLFHPNDTYESGSIKVPGRTLHDHNYVGWGRITFLEGLLRSSNVAFVKLGYFMLGKDKLLDYINKFGFGQKTGIELPGEVGGTINMHYDSEYATATYGQGLTVTGLQIAAAYGAIANGGKLLQPHIVKEIDDPQTQKPVETTAPKFVRQVVSEDTAKQAVLDLEQVVANQTVGTGKKAFIKGYRIAGKTGTANIVPEGEKAYSQDTYLISFVGFAPVEDPRILVEIMIDQPDIGGNYERGSEVWAPIFQDIMSQSLSYLGIPPSDAPAGKTAISSQAPAQVPDLSGSKLAAAKTVLSQAGITAFQTLGGGDKVLQQFPAPGTEIMPDQRIYLITDDVKNVEVPDMTGKSLREAMELCGVLHLACKTSGEGYVSGQTVSGEGDARAVSLELKPLGKAVDPPGQTAAGAAGAAPTPTPSPSSKDNGGGATGAPAAPVKK